MRQRADLLDVSLLESEARRRCGSAGVKVAFKNDIKCAAYDLKSHAVVLPTIRPNGEFDSVEYRGMLIHEVGHANRKDVVARAMGLDTKGTYFNLLNAVEDGVMEREISKDWYGDGVSLGLAHRRHIERDTQQTIDFLESKAKLDPNDVKWNAAYLMVQRARTWDRLSLQEREVLESVQPEEVINLVDELESEGFVKELQKATTCKEVFDFTTKLHKRLAPEDKDPEGKSRADGAAKGTAAGKAGPDGKDGKAMAGSGGTPSDDADNVTKVNWKLLKATDETMNGGFGGRIDYSDWKAEKLARPTLLETRVDPPERTRMAAYRGDKPQIVDLPVAGQLRIALLSEGKAKVLTEQTSGRIDKRKLARLALPVVPGTDSWRRSFRRRIPAKKLNTAVSLLVDGSGSMAGQKMVLAAGAAASTVKTIAGPLRIPMEVNGFSTEGGKNIMLPVKGFNEIVLPEVIAQRCLGFPMSGNSDGEALMWAADRLLKRKEKRKVLLVLSDGQPADGTGFADAGSILKYAIDSCRKRGIEVYGIGIEDSSVRHFYGKDCKVLKNANELGTALVTTLGSKLHRK